MLFRGDEMLVKRNSRADNFQRTRVHIREAAVL